MAWSPIFAYVQHLLLFCGTGLRLSVWDLSNICSYLAALGGDCPCGTCPIFAPIQRHWPETARVGPVQYFLLLSGIDRRLHAQDLSNIYSYLAALTGDCTCGTCPIFASIQRHWAETARVGPVQYLLLFSGTDRRLHVWDLSNICSYLAALTGDCTFGTCPRSERSRQLRTPRTGLRSFSSSMADTPLKSQVRTQDSYKT